MIVLNTGNETQAQHMQPLPNMKQSEKLDIHLFTFLAASLGQSQVHEQGAAAF